ncbi:MAG: hypothetical protein M1537_06945 [Nitrospirae bacterium]|nr:hypothetical protein [Nitrospirota bacterium]MCL5285681.1 hypothetical protein [Nitrospirota bacterium]
MRGQTGTDGSGLPGQAVLPADEKGLLDDADPALLGGHPEPGVARGLRPDRKRLPHAARLLEGGVGEAIKRTEKAMTPSPSRTSGTSSSKDAFAPSSPPPHPDGFVE